jgi:hypothetical protein
LCPLSVHCAWKQVSGTKAELIGRINEAGLHQQAGLTTPSTKEENTQKLGAEITPQDERILREGLPSMSASGSRGHDQRLGGRPARVYNRSPHDKALLSPEVEDAVQKLVAVRANARARGDFEASDVARWEMKRNETWNLEFEQRRGQDGHSEKYE